MVTDVGLKELASSNSGIKAPMRQNPTTTPAIAATPPLQKLPRPFFSRPAANLARDLIGKILVHRLRGRERRARIVETEAYVGTHDLACHAAKGRTRRTEIMFGPAGHAYVYFIYGMYDMFNIIAADVGDAQAVLIRAAEPLDNWTADLSGPGKLARHMQISRAHNGIDLTGKKLFLVSDPTDQPRIRITPRIGVDYAEDWRDAMLRFIDADSSAVSKLKQARPPLVTPPKSKIRRATNHALNRPITCPYGSMSRKKSP
jgi:DNA-3-methyladenine glycosylase